MTEPGARRGPGRPLGADGAETRLKILHSAREVFSTIGFDRASLRQIAEEAGFTRNAIANYYPSKIELYRAALTSVHEVVISEILGPALCQTGSIDRRIVAVFDRAVATIRIDQTFVRFFVTSTADAIHHPDLRDQAMQPLVAVHQHFAAALAAAQRDGEVDAGIDTEATTQVLVDLLWGLAVDAGFYSDQHRTRRTLEALERIVVALT
ncbi:TetR/AcrR family transcriptional regulator [Mycobacterium intracellulare]|uniref:TetR/AcrR family transcriptional regulator n=1 Tax=Mycobacterium intracellulare TaxID=1767 RepID=UPI001CDAAC35|nr:TetR/AcrR family transcriptional regulator [Mycobacterium intracellulare]MCA2252190.1 TetR/AcrR family transcriptional regulator [Mycobacterium intracellulare]UGU03065.1 TetR/AcrR family transcriptional regulator [Mycobacterium intracellulare]